MADEKQKDPSHSAEATDGASEKKAAPKTEEAAKEDSKKEAPAADIKPKTPAKKEAKPAEKASEEKETPVEEAVIDDAKAEKEPEVSAEPAKEVLSNATQYSKIVSGMTVRVHQKIKDVNSKGEEKERVQVFEGMVLAQKHGNEAGATITVRKIANGVGVEKIFPLNLPAIEKIEIVKQADIRQARPYFLREHKKKLREKRVEETITPTS